DFLPNNNQVLINEEIRSKDKVTQTLYIWNIEADQIDQQLSIFKTLDFGVDTMLISSDGKHLFFGYDGGLYMWDIGTDRQVRHFC
ncbi:MAG: hypothetical protein ABI970_18835, partial [Chloroflexota bacterium]